MVAMALLENSLGNLIETCVKGSFFGRKSVDAMILRFRDLDQ